MGNSLCKPKTTNDTTTESKSKRRFFRKKSKKTSARRVELIKLPDIQVAVKHEIVQDVGRNVYSKLFENPQKQRKVCEIITREEFLPSVLVNENPQEPRKVREIFTKEDFLPSLLVNVMMDDEGRHQDHPFTETKKEAAISKNKENMKKKSVKHKDNKNVVFDNITQVFQVPRSGDEYEAWRKENDYGLTSCDLAAMTKRIQDFRARRKVMLQRIKSYM